MLKNFKILLLVTVLSLGLIFYLARSFKKEVVEVKVNDPEVADKAINVVEKISKEQLLENYKSSIKPMLSSYFDIFAKAGSSSESFFGSSTKFSATSSTATVQNELLQEIDKIKLAAGESIVPENFRNMHLKMVLSLSMLKNFLESRSLSDKNRAISFYNEVKKESSELLLP